MRLRKFIALFLSVIMLMSFSTMFVSANTRSVGYPQSWAESIQLSTSGETSATWSNLSNAVATEINSALYTTVYDSIGVVNSEEYYIMNISTDKNLSLSSASTANNTGIGVSSRSNSVLQRWKLTRQSEKKYTVISMYNSTTKGMYANSSTNDVYLYTANSNAALFEMERIDDGEYAGLYLIRWSEKYLTANSSNDVYLTSTLNSGCYWSLSRVDKRHADIYSFNYTYVEDGRTNTYNTTDNDSKFCTTFNNAGYTSSAHPNESDGGAFTDLTQNDDIFIYRGHAGGAKLIFKETNNVVYGYIKADDALPPENSGCSVNDCAANSLASLRCVLYLGCSSAGDGVDDSGNRYNLFYATFEKGAHFVLGTTQTTKSYDSDNFLAGFLDGVNAGKNVYDCYRAGLEKAKNSDLGNGIIGYYPAVFIGDADQYLN